MYVDQVGKPDVENWKIVQSTPNDAILHKIVCKLSNYGLLSLNDNRRSCKTRKIDKSKYAVLEIKIAAIFEIYVAYQSNLNIM